MLPGECVGFAGVVCKHDGEGEPTQLPLKVCQSAAGYYLGYNCPVCGPYSRETGYFETEAEANKAMEDPELHARGALRGIQNGQYRQEESCLAYSRNET